MTGDEPLDWLSSNNSAYLPRTITETIDQLKKIVLQQFTEEVETKQLFYHNEEHIRTVQQRSQQIFSVISPALDSEIDQSRTKLLLDFCAVAHDMVQQFEDNSPVHAARQRRAGESETATIAQLVHYIHQLNGQLDQYSYNSSAKLTDADIAVIEQAINATICAYDPQEQSIYQPLLYSGEPLSIVSRILALADLGTLGMEGIAAYNREGSLLFLETNPDVVHLLRTDAIQNNEQIDPELAENIRQRLLNRSRFQVNFAKSRLARLHRELQGFPEESIPVLRKETFQHLTPTTIQTIETITPTDSETDLSTLLQFFQFEQYLEAIAPNFQKDSHR